MLPETMPASFQATYTPIAAAGTQAQIKHLSRLLATQLTVAGLGKGFHEVQNAPKVRKIVSLFGYLFFWVAIADATLTLISLQDIWRSGTHPWNPRVPQSSSL